MDDTDIDRCIFKVKLDVSGKLQKTQEDTNIFLKEKKSIRKTNQKETC